MSFARGGITSCHSDLLQGAAMDLIYIVGVAAFLGLSLALVIGCEKLHRNAPGGRP